MANFGMMLGRLAVAFAVYCTLSPSFLSLLSLPSIKLDLIYHINRLFYTAPEYMVRQCSTSECCFFSLPRSPVFVSVAFTEYSSFSIY